ncbi:MAG: hypothetical protein HC866_26290 [Leptolyngbyaceae cyanobacterium RU_5_1]|nr:hypothetical protein [Leptolyngbyaceae cyanobacterium RU_5_1]
MKRLISIFISLLILVVIYWKIDVRGLLQVFQNCNGWWMGISLGMVVPITMITAWRLQQLMPGEGRRVKGEGARGSGGEMRGMGRVGKAGEDGKRRNMLNLQSTI